MRKFAAFHTHWTERDLKKTARNHFDTIAFMSVCMGSPDIIYYNTAYITRYISDEKYLQLSFNVEMVV